MNNRGFEPTKGDRDTLTYQLACDLRHICGRSFEWLDQVIPCYDGFPLEEKRAKIKSALASELNGFPMRLRNVLNALQMEDGRGIRNATLCSAEKMEDVDEPSDADDEQFSIVNSQFSIKRMPQGIRDSIEAVGPQLAMPVVTAVCPCIGMLATGVKMDVHGQQKGLNLIAYIAGDFASGKGSIDPVVGAWMSEVEALDEMYLTQEKEWRDRKVAAKNKKDQPEEPRLPVRFVTLNNTVAKLAERLSNTDGKHAFSFTPEADTVAQKWRSAMSDFSVMLRQSYDGSKFDREAKSVDAVSVHIKHLLWNVTMCGTPDALYRVVNNYTDGFQSRIAVARTPDNTFAPLDDKPPVMTDRQRQRIQQIAHLLPLLQGDVVLPKLEDDLLPDALQGVRDAHSEARHERCREHAEAVAEPLEGDAAEDAEPHDAGRLRRHSRLAAGERSLLLPRPHRERLQEPQLCRAERRAPEARPERHHLRAAGRAVHLRAGHAAHGGREGCGGDDEHGASDAEELAQARAGRTGTEWKV